MYNLILIRHGQSEWNKKGLFTGWEDVPLSEKGIIEARDAGLLLKDFKLTKAYTSMLRRAIHTCWLVLEEANQMNIPVKKDWQLNERHYGALQGKNKQEMRELHGDEQVHIWRRSFTTKPPQSEAKEVPYLYKGLDSFPTGESLNDTCKRVAPYWEDTISKDVLSGEQVLIAAHGNSLRALIKHLEKISDDEIVKLEIPTGKPILIKLDKDLNFISREFLTSKE